MRAYEFQTRYTEDGSIHIPVNILKKLKKNQKIKLIIMTEDVDEIKERLNAVDELSHLFDDAEPSKIDKFNQILSERINFNREVKGLEYENWID